MQRLPQDHGYFSSQHSTAAAQHTINSIYRHSTSKLKQAGGQQPPAAAASSRLKPWRCVMLLRALQQQHGGSSTN
jgi:hypothetical protein